MGFLQVAEVVRATDRAALSPLAWSPDGRRFAYGARDGVWVHKPGDPAGAKIADTEVPTAVVWSAGTDVIAYVDRGALWTVRPDGSGRRNIPLSGVASHPAWAPAGDRLALVVQPPGQNAATLWWTSPDGAIVRQIQWVPPRGRWIGSLGWFPDVLYLFVGLARLDGDATVEWWRVRIAYPDFRRLDGPGRPALDPVLSPTGAWIAFVARDGGERAYAVRPDGSAAHPLSPPARRITGLAWSRDGDKLAYALFTDEGQAEIHLADATGGKRQVVATVKLERPDPAAGISIAWSPDESHLAYGANTGAFAGPIWLVRFAVR